MVPDLAVATSGDYRHFFDVNGQRLAHSMDARSGTPVRGDVASVTVLAANCMLADAWATALLVAGAAQGVVWRGLGGSIKQRGVARGQRERACGAGMQLRVPRRDARNGGRKGPRTGAFRFAPGGVVPI